MDLHPVGKKEATNKVVEGKREAPGHKFPKANALDGTRTASCSAGGRYPCSRSLSKWASLMVDLAQSPLFFFRAAVDADVPATVFLPLAASVAAAAAPPRLEPPPFAIAAVEGVGGKELGRRNNGVGREEEDETRGGAGSKWQVKNSASAVPTIYHRAQKRSQPLKQMHTLRAKSGHTRGSHGEQPSPATLPTTHENP